MEHQLEQMEQILAWEKLSLGEFGPQLNLLTELIQESPPQELVLEVLVNEDDVDEPPGLEPIPEDELQNAAALVTTSAPALLTAWVNDEQFTPMLWAWMCELLSPEQLSMIHRMELEHVCACPHLGQTLTSEVQMDVQWQETFQSHGERVPETEFDWELTDSDELVGLFRLQSTEPCLVTAKKYTLWPHTCTYGQCQVICPDAAENGLYLCEALAGPEWMTAEGLIDITFNKYRWAHIDNCSSGRSGSSCCDV